MHNAGLLDGLGVEGWGWLTLAIIWCLVTSHLQLCGEDSEMVL